MKSFTCKYYTDYCNQRFVRVKLKYAMFDIPLQTLRDNYGVEDKTMYECKLVQEKETGRWQAVVYDVNTKLIASSSPHYKDKDRAIEFARSNFAHMCDTANLK